MLLLFDIDGTLLLKAYEEHRQAIHAALRRVYNVRDPAAAKFEAAGRTDRQIARAILMQNDVGAERIDERMRDFEYAAEEEYARRCRGDLSSFVSPGVPELLEQLHGRDGTILSLVTGNLEAIARVKLKHAGIGHFFAAGQGGFGSDHEDRTELPLVARRRAGSWEDPYPREQTTVIGDTPLDIACAHADGVRCVAVTTGPYGTDALHQAEVVVHSARELAAVL